MTRDLKNDLVVEIVKMAQTSPFIWLVELQISASVALRLAAYDAQVTFESVVWYPFPLKIGARIEESTQTVRNLTIVASNAGRAASNLLSAGSLIGKRARVLLVNTDTLADADATIDSEFSIEAATVTDIEATFTLGMENPLGLSFPGERLWRTRCRFLKEYGLTDAQGNPSRCGYDTTLSNLISATNPDFDPTTCDGGMGSETSGNGCKAHGANEAAHGVAQIHPMHNGSGPGIPKGTQYAV